MLVLTRKLGEGIIIGEDVRIKIIEMKGGSVRIGIEAPRDRKIYRQEVYDKICQENLEAANWNIADLDSLDDNLLQKKRKR